MLVAWLPSLSQTRRSPISDLVSLDGRVAVVTGAARGTGTAIARRLAEAGAMVVIGDADGDAAGAAAQEIRSAGWQAAGWQLTVDDELAVAAFADRVVEDLGAIDVWVNNAGIYPHVPALEMTGDQWDEVIDFNLKGVFVGAREAARRMVVTGHGGIVVNIASTSAFRAGGPGMAHYVSSKFGVRGLTQALAVELGPQGIRVLGVAATFTETPGTRARRSDLDDVEYAAYIDGVGARKPLRKVARADDVARVVLFCASDLSSLMTGSTLLVDAGDLA
jgi:NAD(P)-dependent dehydrogenase (short-subunit alcohol dehydrogenase family)